MPYGRGYRRGRRGRRGRSYNWSGYDAAIKGACKTYGAASGLAHTVIGLKKDVGRMKRAIEHKYRDDTYASGDVEDNTGNTFEANVLSDIIQGDGEEQIVGKKYTITSYQAKMTLSRDSGATVDADCVKVWLVLDRQANEATTWGTTEWQRFLGGNYNVNSLRETDWMNRYKVLWTRNFVLTADRPVRMFKVFKKWKKGLNITLGIPGTGTTQVKNQLWLIALSDRPAAGSPPHLLGEARVRYVDL